MKSARFTLTAVIALLVTVFAGSLERSPAEAATFVVDTTSDANLTACTGALGDCSLRGAINAANSAAGADVVNFGIPAVSEPGCNVGTGVCTITPASALPAISEALTIDGYTQSGAAANTNGSGLAINAALKIELNGSGAGALVDGLSVTGGSSTIRGLVINRFGGNGISLETSGANAVEGNFIGTDVAGTVDLGNLSSGVISRLGSSNNTVGGSTPGQRNLIAGNRDGILIVSSTGNQVKGNFIGTDVTRAASLGNSLNGINIAAGGIANTVGGLTNGEDNVIAHNGLAGVAVASDTANNIRRNAIFSNSSLGIDLGAIGVEPNDINDPDTGANNLQNFPLLTNVTSSGGTTTISGSLNSIASTTFEIEFFHSAACDPTDKGEGETFLSSLSLPIGGSNNAAFSLIVPSPVAAGRLVTATATDSSGNTSEFSACRMVNDFDGDFVTDLSDNCPNTANANQLNTDATNQDADGATDEDGSTVPGQLVDGVDNDADTKIDEDPPGDSLGDACDPDEDNDGVYGVDEGPCGGDSLNAGKRPERLDTSGDDDGDTVVNEVLPGGSAAFDCDGDGWKGDQENLVYNDAPSTARDQDPCGNNGWPADLDPSNTLDIGDINSFTAPNRPNPSHPYTDSHGAFNKFGHPLDDSNNGTNMPPSDGLIDPLMARWNLDLPPHLATTFIDIGDLNSINPGVAAGSSRPPMFGGLSAFFTNGGQCPYAS